MGKAVYMYKEIKSSRHLNRIETYADHNMKTIFIFVVCLIPILGLSENITNILGQVFPDVEYIPSYHSPDQAQFKYSGTYAGQSQFIRYELMSYSDKIKYGYTNESRTRVLYNARIVRDVPYDFSECFATACEYSLLTTSYSNQLNVIDFYSKAHDDHSIRLHNQYLRKLRQLESTLKGFTAKYRPNMLHGKVSQVLADGLLVKCESDDSCGHSGLIFVRGYPMQTQVVDDDSIAIFGLPGERYQYTDVTGAVKTYRSFDCAVKPTKEINFCDIQQLPNLDRSR